MSWVMGSYCTARTSAVYSLPATARFTIGFPPRWVRIASWNARAPMLTGIGVSPWPYSTPGISPAWRALRAPPLPRRSRREPLRAMTDMLPPLFCCERARRPLEMSDEQGTEGSLLVDSLHGFAQQSCDRKLHETRGALHPTVIERIGHDHLLDRRRLNALHRSGAEDSVRHSGADLERAVFLQGFSRLAQRACGCDHIVEHHDVLAFDVTDDVHDLHRVRAR